MMEAERQVKEVWDRLQVAKSRQKSYYDSKHRQISFEPGEYAYLRVTPMKGVKRFHTRGKLAPRYLGPFPVIARKDRVAYQLELPPELSDIHDVFHISQLRKCIAPPIKQVDMTEIELAKDLTYEEKPVRILDEMERTTRSKVIRFYKVLWEHHTKEEATWEREDFLRSAYPYLFPEQPNLKDEIHPKGGRFVTPRFLTFSFIWFLLN